MFRSRPLSLAILLAVAPLSASAAERADLLIRNAIVVDVEHASARAGQSVVIRGEDIVAVARTRSCAASGARPARSMPRANT